MSNIKIKLWSQILGPGSGFLTLTFRSRSWDSDPESWVLDSGQFTNYYKCNEKLSESVTVITNFDRKFLSVIGIAKCDRCYKV